MTTRTTKQLRMSLAKLVPLALLAIVANLTACSSVDCGVGSNSQTPSCSAVFSAIPNFDTGWFRYGDNGP